VNESGQGLFCAKRLEYEDAAMFSTGGEKRGGSGNNAAGGLIKIS
jgi:hypothetical protein